MRSCKTNFIILLLFLALPFSLLYQAPESWAREDSITIGLIPEMNVFKQQKRFKPLADYLSKHMDIPVRLSILSRYGNIIQRVKEKDLDGAFLGSFTGALAISQLDVEPLARPINMDGTSTYYGQIFVRKDSNIKTAADMKGKTLALVERATTAGYVFPLAWLKMQGIENLDTHFKEHFFTGSHDAAIDAVLNGDADIGAAKNTIFERIRQAKPVIDRELTILVDSPRVPSNGLCVRKELPEKQKNQLKKLLLNLHLDNFEDICNDFLEQWKDFLDQEDDEEPSPV
jgi:phosphonate transport system substrate-binding protein